MKLLKNIRLKGADDRPFLLDAYFDQANTEQPVVIFSHGFKGFKDWGHWSFIARSFVEAGFVFITYNFSHNGTTVDASFDFEDLEAFGNNNFSKELFDLGEVINWLQSDNCEIPKGVFNIGKLSLIGHSRGGALSIIKASKDDRVKALITWASVDRLDYAWGAEGFLENWRAQGVYHVINGRTGQEMPLYFQLFEDFQSNQPDLDTRHALKKMNQPYLIIHGKADPGVNYQSAKNLNEWYPGSQIRLIEAADHVFGGRHPFEEEQLPAASKELVDSSISFLSQVF